jgi:hypothetical protein
MTKYKLTKFTKRESICAELHLKLLLGSLLHFRLTGAVPHDVGVFVLRQLEDGLQALLLREEVVQAQDELLRAIALWQIYIVEARCMNVCG